MAITKIAGELLESNLLRTTNLEFQDGLLTVDVLNGRIGIGTDSPGNFKLDVDGHSRIQGNQTITGDLIVQGNTTTIDSQNLVVEDNIITLNENASTATDSGIMIQRAGENQAVFYWDETVDKFRVGTTPEDGSTRTDFTNITLAKLQVAEPLADSDASTRKYVDDNISTVSSSVPSSGGDITLGLPTDSSFGDGSAPLNTGGTVTDAIDDLNEVQENIRLGYYVKSVTYTRTPASGSLGVSVSLNITAVGGAHGSGGADRYLVDWGDGTTTTESSTTPSHAYSENSGTPYTITVKAYNNSAITDSSGSFANSGDSMTNLTVTVYTATPVISFELYTASSGGSALTGNDLYSEEGQTRHLRNTSEETGGATVAYTMSWGDGSSTDNIANDSAAGGVSGARLSHTWGAAANSGTGRHTLTLSLTAHTTCDPALLPITATALLKVYNDVPAGPNNIGNKTIAIHSEDLVGTSPKLCSGFQENVSGSPTYTAGDSVNRVASDGSSRLRTATQTTFAYNAAAGTLSAEVNGIENGSISLSGSDNSGVATSLHLQEESDFNLLDATGAATSFATSIYKPNHFSGHKSAINSVTDSSGLLNTGVNSFQIKSTSPSSVATNVLEFVLDPLTATPTTTIGTVAQGTAGSFRYISGVPYYNSGSPTVTVTGTTVTNFTGQTYQDTATPHQISGATTSEGSGNVLATNPTSFTYANIDGASTMLSSGIPVAHTGLPASPYTLGAVTCPLYASSRASVQTIQALTKNSNGSGSNSASATKIQLFTQTPTGLNKEDGGIAVSDSLGATHDDDAVRIYNFASATTDNPAFVDSGAMNYYTDDVFTGAKTVAGTREAICRFGTISHNTTNYSTGYLPAGPDLNTGRSGTQYYTFAFRRTNMANFNLTMSGVVSGMFIAAPGTAIDGFSGLNGWLTCSTVAISGGVPGSNGGNGGDGCAVNSGDVVAGDGSTIYSNQEFTFTLGEENGSNARGNVILVRIKLESGDSVTALEID
jgi:hypothetical protein